jgi:phospholipase C
VPAAAAKGLEPIVRDERTMRFRTVSIVVILSSALLALSDCRSRSPVEVADLKTIEHIVIIVQENRSVDNLLNGFPGVDTARFGYDHAGRKVPLRPVDFNTPYDISHSLADFLRDYDHGKMDGYDLAIVSDLPGAHGKRDFGKYPEYKYLRREVVEPYFAIGREFATADRMFQSNLEQSFAAHLFLIAGTSGGVVDIPSGRPWGCDAGPETFVPVMNKQRKITRRVFPCFPFRTLGDELDERSLTWAYYAPQVGNVAEWRAYNRAVRQHRSTKGLSHPDFGGLWSSYDAIDHIRFGPDWDDNVVSPENTVLRDIRQRKLRSVSWVIPDFKNSDHSLSRSDTGPSWVASIVNEIGTSAYWENTVILVTWDDSGGWYDHVRPPQLAYDGLGSRVPLFVIGKHVKRGYISHHRLEFGSLLKFVETRFDLKPLTDTDKRALDLREFFDFRQTAAPFERIPAKYDTDHFLNQKPSYLPPDND